jgi:hypothetical protein
LSECDQARGHRQPQRILLPIVPEIERSSFKSFKKFQAVQIVWRVLWIGW